MEVKSSLCGLAAQCSGVAFYIVSPSIYVVQLLIDRGAEPNMEAQLSNMQLHYTVSHIKATRCNLQNRRFKLQGKSTFNGPFHGLPLGKINILGVACARGIKLI